MVTLLLSNELIIRYEEIPKKISTEILPGITYLLILGICQQNTLNDNNARMNIIIFNFFKKILLYYYFVIFLYFPTSHFV